MGSMNTMCFNRASTDLIICYDNLIRHVDMSYKLKSFVIFFKLLVMDHIGHISAGNKRLLIKGRFEKTLFIAHGKL